MMVTDSDWTIFDRDDETTWPEMGVQTLVWQAPHFIIATLEPQDLRPQPRFMSVESEDSYVRDGGSYGPVWWMSLPDPPASSMDHAAEG